MKNLSIISRLNLSITVLAAFFLMFSSCTKEDSITQYNPQPTPVPLTTYEVKDVYNGQERTYEMSLHTLQGAPADHFIFCNFSNYKVNVKAYIENGQVSIPPQSFSADGFDLEIYDGTGTLSTDELKITFWAHEAGRDFTHELVGIFLN